MDQKIGDCQRLSQKSVRISVNSREDLRHWKTEVDWVKLNNLAPSQCEFWLNLEIEHYEETNINLYTKSHKSLRQKENELKKHENYQDQK